MKKIVSGLSIAAIFAAVILAVPHAGAFQYAPPPPAPEPWAAPPPDLQGVEQQGFRDGIEGARKDAQNHRPPNVNNRDEYRHPSVPARDRRAYRAGFRRGYQVGVNHLMRTGRY